VIGLKIEIDKRKKAIRSSNGEKFSIRYISDLLGVAYTTVKLKLAMGNFTTEEAFGIFYALIPSENQNLETLLYLFSEQNKKGEQK
jgi:hypothetical protein